MTKLCDFPFPIYDRTKILISYLWPLQHVHTCTNIVVLNMVYKGLLLIVSLTLMRKELLLNTRPSSRLEYKNHTLFMAKMTKIDALFMTKTAEKLYPLGAAHTYIAHKREYTWAAESAILLNHTCLYLNYNKSSSGLQMSTSDKRHTSKKGRAKKKIRSRLKKVAPAKKCCAR